MRFLYHTQRRATVGRTPLDELSARRRDLYLTTHNTHNRQTSMPPVGFEPTISAGERPQNYALDRAATETGMTITEPVFIKLTPAGQVRVKNTLPNFMKIQQNLCSQTLCHRRTDMACIEGISFNFV